MTNIQEKQEYLDRQPEILGPPVPNTISLDEFYSIFPDEITAERWFENLRWPTGITCHRCGSDRFSETESENRSQVVPYWCYYCRKRFSVRTGTLIQGAKIPLKKWALAVYLSVNGPIAATVLSGYLGTETHTAWSVVRRIREAWGDPEPLNAFEAEIDETYFGKGKGRGTAGKIIVLGIKDRFTGRIAAKVIPRADLDTIEPFVELHMQSRGTLYSDGARVYREVKCVGNHQFVVHSNGEYVNGTVHVNGLESFWSALKLAYYSIYNHISRKYFPLYVNEMVGRQNIRDKDTMEKMEWLASRLVKDSEG